MKAVDSEFDRELLPEIKDLVWVDTVGWDDADLQGELTFCRKMSVCSDILYFRLAGVPGIAHVIILK
jgi:hypothetical protein